jgi:hypothetical protein
MSGSDIIRNQLAPLTDEAQNLEMRPDRGAALSDPLARHFYYPHPFISLPRSDLGCDGKEVYGL